MKESSSSILALVFVVFVLVALLFAGGKSRTGNGALTDSRERISELALGLLLAAK